MPELDLIIVGYFNRHPEAQAYVNAHPEVEIAYQYLLEKWQQSKENEGPSGDTANEKLDALFNGLTDYFLHSTGVQEELVKIATQAAGKVILAEGLLAALDQNTHITGDKTLEERIDETISILLPFTTTGGNDAKVYKNIPQALLDAVVATREAADEKAKITASRKLRTQIQDWVQEDFQSTDLGDYEHLIAKFNSISQKRTKGINDYEGKLITLHEALTSLQNSHKAPLTTSDIEQVIDQLLKVVSDRITEVENFRNGLTLELSPQNAMLNNYRITNPEISKVLGSDFLRQNGDGHFLLTVEDIEPVLNQVKTPPHPLIAHITSINDNLQMLNISSDSTRYKNEFATIEVKENGIKPWKSTIDKLEKYTFDWERLRDLSRVYTIFNNAESMFFYNTILRDIAKKENWQIAKDGNDWADDGIKVQPSGKIYWAIHMKKGSAISEIHMEDASEMKFEPVTHEIYKLVRMFQVNNKEQDFSKISDKQFDEFCEQGVRIISALLNLLEQDPLMPTELKKRLERTALLIESRDQTLLPTVYKTLMDCHIIVTAHAAKQSTPSMAALYDNAFHAMATKKKKKSPEMKADIDEKIKLYEAFGPRSLPADPVLGQFEEHHQDRCKELIAEWEKSWPEIQQKAM